MSQPNVEDPVIDNGMKSEPVSPSNVTLKQKKQQLKVAELLTNIQSDPKAQLVAAAAATADPDTGTSSGRWTEAEDESLRLAVKEIGARNWKRVARDYLADARSDVQCLHRWQKVLRPGLVKGPWTAEEDETIRRCMSQGHTRWSEIAKQVPGRIGKQCRERWFNHLDPEIKKTEWTQEEDAKLIEGQQKLGNKWSLIAKQYLPGRPENAVKNRWNAATRRRKSGEDTPSNLKGQSKPKTPKAEKKVKKEPKSKAKKEALKQSAAESLVGLAALKSLCDVASAMQASEASYDKKSTRKRKAALEASSGSTKKKKQVTGPRSAKRKNNKDALDAAELLASGLSVPHKKSRGSSFMASRPNLPAPANISVAVAKKPGNKTATLNTADTTTPVWKSPKGTSISPPNNKTNVEKDAASALQNLLLKGSK